MEVHDAIRTRRAVRSYEDRPVRRETLAQVIEDAVWAPSGMNRQPWRFVVVEGRETLAACAAAAKAQMLKAVADQPEMAAVRGMLEAPGFDMFYGAPALVVICATMPDEMALKDCCLAAQTLMLAAHALGLGTCWIGLAESWLATPEAKARLGVPDGCRPVAPIIVGYPLGDAHHPERRAPDIAFVA